MDEGSAEANDVASAPPTQGAPAVDVSLLDGVAPDTRSVELRLMQQHPGAVDVAVATAWRDLAERTVAATPAECPEGVSEPHWTNVRRSALRDVEAATGWLKRAEAQAGNTQLTERLVSLGWEGNQGDQPAWTAMEQSARAILQCQELMGDG